MSGRKWNFAALSILYLALLALPANLAAMMVGLSTDELTEKSETVVVGRVESKESHWSDDGSIIMTSAVVIVEDAIKGDFPSEPLIIRYQGGEIGNIGMKSSDSTPLHEGERVLLFLKSDEGDEQSPGALNVRANKTFKIVGKGQGKYEIGSDEIARKKGFSVATGEKAVDNDIPLSSLIQKIRKGANR